ncbi:MAG: PQQ-binding-like beta-propeller repeat protein, partial [Candidatus Thermoplasmatota archaeon]|nr:PQQ-binding-like beta-propeller repeat protein [Candidatus Thermoplasmatota archaeon]
VFGTHLETISDSVVSDYEFASTAYDSDSTISETVVLSEYLNPQPTVLLDNGLMDSAWPMKCHDLHHTSRSPYAADDGGGLEKWRFKTGSHVESSVVIDDNGIIYFGAFDSKLRAIYPNGTLKWEYKVGDYIWSAPALADDGTIYVGSFDDKIHALYPNGTRKWVFQSGGSIASSPAVADDGTIYFGTEGFPDDGGCRIHALNPDGTEKWFYQTAYKIASDPAIGDDGTIYIGSGDTYVYALNPNGTLKWRFKTGDWVKAHPAIANDGTVYISSFDGWLYALNPVNGSLIWKYTDGGDEASPALGPDGIIYLGNSHLRAIYPNGTLKYSVDLGSNIYHASPALSADGVLYVGAGNSIFAVDSSDGSVLWQKNIANEGVDSSPIIGPDGMVYIGSGSRKRIDVYGSSSLGYLHAFGPVASNSPPETPVITGSVRARVHEWQCYKFTTVDPDLNPVSFYSEWGDDNFTNWTMEAASQEIVCINHEWQRRGSYTIRCKARDTVGAESDWATYAIRIPYSYSYHPGWQWLQSLFPLLSRLLNLLGGLL